MLIPDSVLDRMENLYTSVIPGVMDSCELEDMRNLIRDVRALKKALGEAADDLATAVDDFKSSGMHETARIFEDAEAHIREFLGTEKK